MNSKAKVKRFMVVGHDETDRVFVSVLDGHHSYCAEFDIPNGAKLVRQTLISALGDSNMEMTGSLGQSSRGHRIELAEQDGRYFAKTSVEFEWKGGDEIFCAAKLHFPKLDGLFVTQRFSCESMDEDSGSFVPLGLNASCGDAHLVFMPRQIAMERANIWDLFERSGNKEETHRKWILLLTVEVLRNASFRLREDGSTSAAIEDAFAIIVSATKAPANMSISQGTQARQLFMKFGHIFLRIRSDAVVHFWFDEKGDRKATLYYAKNGDRSEWLRQRHSAFGLDAVLAGSLALAIRDGFGFEQIRDRLREGVARMSNLIRRGYADTRVSETNAEGWKIAVEDLMAPKRDVGLDLWKRSSLIGSSDTGVLEICVAIEDGTLRGAWDLFETACKNEYRGQKRDGLEICRDVSERIIKEGPDEMSNQRVFRLGKLRSFDRDEVDGLAGLWRLMSTYLRDPERPLSVGVFGSPGSGKSFAVKEVAASVLSQMPGKKSDPLEFNVAQFTSLKDLATALHKVRDRYLENGRVPVAIFDEFDAGFGGIPFGWLQYFLMPMQDGQFKDDGQIFHTGRAIFIFCGGLNRSFDEFSSRQRDQEFCSAKGPDFISRLRGILNIPSLDRPDDVDPNNIPKWIVRRAMLLHHYLKKHHARIDDAAVRRAFLEVDFYRHGARSLEAIIDMCSSQPSGVIDRTSLPRRDQLELHTDAAGFWKAIRGYAVVGGAGARIP